MEKLLDTLELSDCWEDRNNIIFKTSFALTVRKKLKDTFNQTWEKQMSTSNNMTGKLDFCK